MRITRNQLRRVIREELTRHLFEQDEQDAATQMKAKIADVLSVWNQMGAGIMRKGHAVKPSIEGLLDQAIGLAGSSPARAIKSLDMALANAQRAGFTPGDDADSDTARDAWNKTVSDVAGEGHQNTAP